jgi:hypothetical protein
MICSIALGVVFFYYQTRVKIMLELGSLDKLIYLLIGANGKGNGWRYICKMYLTQVLI